MFPKKINTPAAVRERNNFPLDHIHQTTSDFGMTQITDIIPLAPTDTIDYKLKTFAQMFPLQKPTLGNAHIVHRAFFVPFDFICADWQSFISNHSLNADSALSQPQLPVFNVETLGNLFFGISNPTDAALTELNFDPTDAKEVWLTKDNYYSLTGTVTQFLDFFDIYLTFNNGNPPSYFDYSNTFNYNGIPTTYVAYYRFTPLGKNIWNIFNQLGYNIGTPSFKGFSMIDGAHVFPLFSIVKIFIDNYVDARYNWSEFSTFFRMFTSEYWNTLSDYDRALSVHDMLVLCAFAWFDNDLFTSAWQSHSNPSLNGLFKSFSISENTTDPAVNVSTATNANKDPYLNVGPGGTYQQISQHMLDVLKAVTSYFTRNNVAGSRPIDVLLARFKVKQPEILARMSEYLGSFSAPVKISEVVATSAGNDNSGNWNALAEKGGKGVISSDGNMHIKFENKWFYGYFVVISHIMPDVRYYQGIKPHVLMSSRFDFYTPEFDELGSEAMPKKVLFADLGRATEMNSDAQNYAGNSIFGFVPRYYQYKFGFDTLSGDFRLARYVNSLRPYQMFREVTGSEQDFDNSKLQNNLNFRLFSDMARENYDKMFVSQDISEDHFIIINEVECNANRPMSGVGKSLIGKIEGGRDMVALNPTGKKF